MPNLFENPKSIVGMIHVGALPDTPRQTASLDQVIQQGGWPAALAVGDTNGAIRCRITASHAHQAVFQTGDFGGGEASQGAEEAVDEVLERLGGRLATCDGPEADCAEVAGTVVCASFLEVLHRTAAGGGVSVLDHRCPKPGVGLPRHGLHGSRRAEREWPLLLLAQKTRSRTSPGGGPRQSRCWPPEAASESRASFLKGGPQASEGPRGRDRRPRHCSLGSVGCH